MLVEMRTYTYKCNDCKEEWGSDYVDEKYCSGCGSTDIKIIDTENIEDE